MYSLDKSTLPTATAMLDEAIKYASNSKYTTLEQVRTKMVAECKSYNGDGKSFLKEKCDIDFDNDDTGAITGSDAGGSTTKTAKSVIPETGTKKSFNGTSFTVTDNDKDYGVTFVFDGDSMTGDKKHLWECLYNWWAKESLKLIEESYGYSFTDSNSKYHKLYLQFNEESYKAATNYAYDGLSLIVSLKNYYDFSSTDYDGISPKEYNYLDRTVSHELTHAVMLSKLKNFSQLPLFLTEGLADLNHGTDATREGYMRDLAGDISSLKKYLDHDMAQKPPEGTKDTNPYYAAGYIFLRYIAKQFSSYADRVEYADSVIEDENSLPKGLTRDGALLTAASTFKGNAIYLPDYSNVTKVNASALSKGVEITGSTLNDSVKGGKGADTIFGGMGNDSLWGGAGNDTLKGGDGKDLFIYSAGNDFIADYATGDKISIGAAISKSSVKGSNATFTIGKNTLTVKNGKGKELVFIDAEGTERTIIGGAYLATDSSSSNSTLSSWREVGDASARTKAIKLTGNELNNSLIGGSGKDSLYGADGNDYLAGGSGNDKLYGQNGDDTLWGGIGNDTLKGGDGADVFIYNSGEGKDVISDFANDDMLQITGTFSATYNKSSKTIAFKVGSTASAITLKNFTATTFNVNGDTWKISGSKLVKK